MRRGLVRIARLVALAGAAAIALSAGTASTARAGNAVPGRDQRQQRPRRELLVLGCARPRSASDYQNTDCIHQSAGGNPGGTNGAAHTSGELSSWSDSNGTIEMDGVSIVGGLATANYYISDQRHSNTFTLIVTSEVAPVLPVGVPLTWSGRAVQVQVAP